MIFQFHKSIKNCTLVASQPLFFLRGLRTCFLGPVSRVDRPGSATGASSASAMGGWIHEDESWIGDPSNILMGVLVARALRGRAGPGTSNFEHVANIQHTSNTYKLIRLTLHTCRLTLPQILPEWDRFEATCADMFTSLGKEGTEVQR